MSGSDLEKAVDAAINKEFDDIGLSIYRNVCEGNYISWNFDIKKLNALTIDHASIKLYIDTYSNKIIKIYDKNNKAKKINIDEVAKYIAQNIIKRRLTHIYLYKLMDTKTIANKQNLDEFIKKAVELQTIIKKVNAPEYILNTTKPFPSDLGALLQDIIGDAKALATSQEEMNKFWPEAFPLLVTEQGTLTDLLV